MITVVGEPCQDFRNSYNVIFIWHSRLCESMYREFNDTEQLCRTCQGREKKSLWISVVSQSLNFLPIYFKACDPEHGFVRFHWSSIICFLSLQVFIASIKDLKRGLPAFGHAITNRASGKKKHANPVCNEKPLQFPWAYNQFVNHIRRIRNNISKA